MSLTHSATEAVAVLRFVLPFPPSVNRYYRHVGYRTLLSREGRLYRESVCTLLTGRVGQSLSGPLQVQLDLYPPDRRRRDWDNFQKGIWDALQHAGVYQDDSQVKRAVVEMHEPDGDARAVVEIQPRNQEPFACQSDFKNTNRPGGPVTTDGEHSNGRSKSPARKERRNSNRRTKLAT